MSTVAAAIEPDEIAVLRLLALEGGLYDTAKVSCSGLADDLEVSNQTASRRLQRLEDEGMIEREQVPDGQRIRVSDRGRRLLRREFETYQRIFGDGASVTVRGTVTDGMGEGRHYIPLEGYRTQFIDRLGYEPYPGTLNVILDDESVRRRTHIAALSAVPIDGWEDDERTYGPAACYPVTIRTESGATYDTAHAIIPERTHHDEDKLELIAPDRLRDTLDLTDGEEIEIELAGTEE